VCSSSIFLLCADDCPGDGFLAISAAAEEPGDAEVGDLGDHGGVEEHVCSLEVPVDDVEPRVLVKVEDTPGDPEDDVQPRLPPQRRTPPSICTHARTYANARPPPVQQRFLLAVAAI